MAETLSLRRTTIAKPGPIPALAKALTTIWVWRRRMQNRAELKRVLERADDHMLSDIGLTRSTLADEAGKAFWRR